MNKIRDVICVIHGIGPDGCTAAASVSTKLKNNNFPNIVIGQPHIQLWDGLPTLHIAIQKSKG